MGAYEDLLAFLAPFAEGADGYLGFTKANRSVDTPEDNKKWGDFVNWFGATSRGEVDLPFDILSEDPKWEYYFTPAVLFEESRLQSKFQHSNVIWIDFDEPVEWENFDPSPSIVVQTSEQKFHCYWLLHDPITNANDMRYWCKRFLKYFSGGDESGFDATQLLKLPWGLNLKLGAQSTEGAPWAPRVIKFEPDLKYTELDFVEMPEPEIDLDPVVDLGNIPDLPDPEFGFQKYIDMYQDSLTKKIQTKILEFQDGGEEKRSGALYNIICEAYDALDDPEKVYQVLLGSPNDKFTADHGPRGAHLLWKDIHRVASKRKNRERAVPRLATGIQDILNDKELSKRDKDVEITNFIMNGIREIGEFIQTDRGEYYYADRRTGDSTELFEVEKDVGCRFVGKLIRKRNDLKQGSDQKIITNIIYDAILECQEKPRVSFYHFAHYDVYTNTVYVDRYDGTMYVLNGETIEQKPVGYNDVYFYRDPNNKYPRPYERTTYDKGGLEALILDGPNYTTQGNKVSREQIHHMLKTWIASFFFPEMMSTRPIVLVHGQADSGKTTVFQNISLMLTGDSTLAVTGIPDKKELFDTQVSQSSYIFYDNVEVNKKELQERLAQVATGYNVKVRQLYTTNKLIDTKARSFVGITSRTVERIQNDVAERMLVFPVHPFASQRDDRKSLNSIQKKVLDNRDALWSELLDFVNATIKEIGRHGLQRGITKLRMADYGGLLDLTSGMVGLSYGRMEDYLKGQQTKVVVENDPIFSALTDMVESLSHDPEYKFTSKELHAALCRINRKMASRYPTSNKLAIHIRSLTDKEQLEGYGITIETLKSGNNTLYQVRDRRS